MSMTRHVILNHVDTPLKILFWTIPELLMLIVPTFTGIILDQVTLGLLSSFLMVWGNKKYQQHFGKGQFQAVRYWFLPKNKRFKKLPPSYVREYIG